MLACFNVSLWLTLPVAVELGHISAKVSRFACLHIYEETAPMPQSWQVAPVRILISQGIFIQTSPVNKYVASSKGRKKKKHLQSKLPKIKMAPGRKPSQEKNSLPTPIVQVLCVDSSEGRRVDFLVLSVWRSRPSYHCYFLQPRRRVRASCRRSRKREPPAYSPCLTRRLEWLLNFTHFTQKLGTKT